MDLTRDGFAELAPEDKALVNDACDEFEAALQSGEAPVIERHLGGWSGVVRDVLLRELLYLAIEAELRRHGSVDLDALTRALPEARPLADEVLEEARRCAALSQPLDPGAAAGEPERNGAAWPKPLGHFLLKKELGSGAFGTVFLADDTELGREVALKVPHPTTLFSQELRQRFLREGEVAMRLDHPNLVRVLEVGEIGMVSYIASAYEEGATLARWLEQRGGRAPAREAAELTEKLARAVHHAHERGVLHCDLKPGNVLLASGGRQPPEGADSGDLRPPLAEAVPKIADFGLAKLVGDRSDLSQTGQILGSPSYMAPEQAAGRRSEITARTDVYGLGAILYELLTGRPPFAEKSLIETLARVLGEEPARPRALAPGVPADLETVCLQCLEKDPRRRYASAAELADDLRRFLDGQPITARPIGSVGRSWRWCRRHPAVTALSGLLALALVVGAGVGFHQWREARENAALAFERQREAEAALARAEDLLQRLDQALAEASGLGGSLPGRTSRLTSARLTSLRLAASYYEGLLKERPGDTHLAARLAQQLTDIGCLECNSRQLEAAVEHCRRARDLWDEVCGREQDDLAHRLNRARCLCLLAMVLFTDLRPEEALEVGREAARAWEAVPEKLYSVGDKALFTETARNLGTALAARGDAAAGQAEIQRARTRLERWCREEPSDYLKMALGGAIAHEAGLRFARGDEAGAVRCWREAYALGKGLGWPVASPMDWASTFFGAACRNLTGRPDVEPYYGTFVGLAERELQEVEWQAESDPTNPAAAYRGVCIAGELVEVHLRAGHPERAVSTVDRVGKIVARLARQEPPSDLKNLAVAECHLDYAGLRVACGSARAGLDSARQARDLLAAVTGTPTDRRAVARLGALAVRASSALRTCGGESRESLPLLELLERTREKVAAVAREDPDDPALVHCLFDTWEQIGKCHIRLKQPDKAVQAWIEGVAVLRRGLERRPGHAAYREKLALRCSALGRHFLERGRDEEARHWLGEVAKLRPEDPETLRLTQAALRKLPALPPGR